MLGKDPLGHLLAVHHERVIFCLCHSVYSCVKKVGEVRTPAFKVSARIKWLTYVKLSSLHIIGALSLSSFPYFLCYITSQPCKALFLFFNSLFFNIYVCMYVCILAAPGLRCSTRDLRCSMFSCGMWDLQLQHANFLAAECMWDLVSRPGIEPRPPAL